MNILLRLWNGELTLHDVFWHWDVIGGLTVNTSSSGLSLLLIIADRPILGIIVGYAFSIPYNITVFTSVWRSANRFKGDPRWADYARIATVLGGILLSAT
jgi:hypothetical protein